MTHESDRLQDFARCYTEAWCSQDPVRVAAHYAAAGSLTINEGTPSVGPEAITEAARSFMVAFPDLRVLMDDVRAQGDNTVYRWTLVGTNTGPGGTGRPVRISGFEEWTFDEDGLIAASLGQFDQDEYDRQLGPEAG
jgi:nuclear transport factor 2 (NTF2) superfamily protein